MKIILKGLILFFYWSYKNFTTGTKIYNKKISPRKVKVGKQVMIRKGTEISGDITIGDYSYISSPNTYVSNAIIGKHCSIARNVTIGVGGHNYHWVTTGAIIVDSDYNFIPNPKDVIQKDTPIIGNDVWIGMNTMIMRGVKIGDGAVIAAGSVVTKDVEPYSIVAGIPAKHIKFRFGREQINALLRIKWWDWSDEKIKENIGYFYDIDLFIKKTAQ